MRAGAGWLPCLPGGVLVIVEVFATRGRVLQRGAGVLWVVVGVVGGAARVYRYMLLLWAGHADMGVGERWVPAASGQLASSWCHVNDAVLWSLPVLC